MIAKRVLGRTGLAVSQLGFGAWGIGKTSWIGAQDQESVAALVAARDAGITFFDTALVYGRGHSERLIAQTLGRAAEVVIASKAPPKNMRWPAPPHTPLREAYPRDHVLESLHATLRNLGRDEIDLYQFHVWSDDWANEEEWQETVAEIRNSGKVRFVGISINDHQPENVVEALRTGIIDTVQVIYNIFDQSPEDVLLPYCAQHNIGVIARVPFDEGGLTGAVQPDSSFPEGDFRNRYFSGERKAQLWRHLQEILADTGVAINELPDLALRFCISAPEIATAIPGMRSARHVQRNAASMARGPLSPELRRILCRHRWIRNFYAPEPVKAPSKLGRLKSLLRGDERPLARP